MKVFQLKDKALSSETGEQILGSQETGSHACYMIYGVLKPGEEGKTVKPGLGHEEIVLAAIGDIEVSGHFEGTLREGAAFHICGDNTCVMANNGASDAVYIISGGHSEGGHH